VEVRIELAKPKFIAMQTEEHREAVRLLAAVIGTPPPLPAHRIDGGSDGTDDVGRAGFFRTRHRPVPGLPGGVEPAPSVEDKEDSR